MFSGNFDMEPDEDGCYFIDRNPDFFPVILDYLRKGSIHLEEIDESQMADFVDEVEYYQIDSLLNLMRESEEKEMKQATFYWELDSSSFLELSDNHTGVSSMSLSFQTVLANRGFTEGRHQWGVRVVSMGPHLSIGITQASISLTQGYLGNGADGWCVNGDGLAMHNGVTLRPLSQRDEEDDLLEESGGVVEETPVEPLKEGDLLWVVVDMNERQVAFTNGSVRWPPIPINCEEVIFDIIISLT